MSKSIIILLLSVFIFSHVLCNSSDVTILTVSPCPQVQNCVCIDQNVKWIQCFGAGPEKLAELQEVYGSDIESLEFSRWPENQLKIDDFAIFEKLEKLSFIKSEIESINSTEELKNIKMLTLDDLELENDEEICNVIEKLENLQKISLKRNFLTKFDCDGIEAKLKDLDVSGNQIAHFSFPEGLTTLNISGNLITNLDNISTSLIELDISNNQISNWTQNLKFEKLEVLRAEGLLFDTGFNIDAPKLKELRIDNSIFTFLDFHQIRTPSLKRLSGIQLMNLKYVAGKLVSNVEHLELTNTKLFTLPDEFFEKIQSTNSEKEFNVTSSQFQCEPCLLKWTLPIYELAQIDNSCNITRQTIEETNCKLGILGNETETFGFYEKDTILECLAYGKPTPKISWYRFRPSQKLGSYEPKMDRIDYQNVTELARESYQIMSGGALMIKNANRSHVERYVCVAENEHGKEWAVLKFRLDYKDWYSLNIFKSVFFGGLAMSIIVCFISFLLNITWILTRKSALWWIQRAERLSRVRKMVEAMEKYRVRQMESLHDKYTKRCQLVRDNYHQQVEAIRLSYSSQSEKFRDYRAQQMGAVSSHLENLRENYNTQLARVREYGAKRSELLWESYERQVNRMRTFSLQHRLKLMRQYKVKQRYLNKLLESFQDETPEGQKEGEEKVRAALEMTDPTEDLTIDSRLSRSSSFHSLPEYLIDERGYVQPGIPPSTQNIRFSHITKSSFSPTPSTSSAINQNSRSSEKAISSSDVPSTSYSSEKQ